MRNSPVTAIQLIRNMSRRIVSSQTPLAVGWEQDGPGLSSTPHPACCREQNRDSGFTWRLCSVRRVAVVVLTYGFGWPCKSVRVSLSPTVEETEAGVSIQLCLTYRLGLESSQVSCHLSCLFQTCSLEDSVFSH